MVKVPEATDSRINNALYEKDGERWWQDDNVFYTLRVSVLPARLSFTRRHLQLPQDTDVARRKALDVGCGGGLLTKEIAKMGFAATGIDQAETSIRTAREHARASGLCILYDTGDGEHLPYPDNEFDVVFCCEVLEHVDSVGKVIAEISRVMKPGGPFIFDTFK